MPNRDEFDGAVMEEIEMFNETYVAMRHVRPVLQAWGITEADFDDLRRQRISGPDRGQARQLMHQIYQEAGRRQFEHACERLRRVPGPSAKKNVKTPGEQRD